MNGISTLIRRDPREVASSLSALIKWECDEKTAVRNPAREPSPHWHPDLRLPASRTMRNKLLSFNHPVCGILLQEPERTKAFVIEKRGKKLKEQEDLVKQNRAIGTAQESAPWGLPWWCSGIHLPTQGTRVRALVREDPTCRGATKPMRHNHWARVPQLLKTAHLEPVLRDKRSHRSEKPAHHNERVAPAQHN